MGKVEELLEKAGWVEIPQIDVMRSDTDSLICWKLVDLLDAQNVKDWHLYEARGQEIRKYDAVVVGSPHPAHSVKKLLEVGLIRPADLPLLGYLPRGVIAVEKKEDLTSISLLYEPQRTSGSSSRIVGGYWNDSFWIQ